MPSGHKAYLVHNIKDVDLLLMHNTTFAAEYVYITLQQLSSTVTDKARIGHAVSARKRIEIIARAKQLGVKVTNPKARVTTEV